jgi:pSer/pThr/pTyr-binding forkhead associated (FHA) protein
MEITMDDYVLCPMCLAKNQRDTPQCVRCHMPLSRTLEINQQTDKIPEYMPEIGKKRGLSKELPANVLGLLIQGHEDPIRITDPTRVVLGRDDEIGPFASVDFTPYGGLVLGVSRQHALITRGHRGYTVEDSASTNGTWLNDVRLVAHQRYELQSGDKLRLGHLIVFVYFRLEDLDQETLYFTDAKIDESFQPDYLAKVIVPYICALDAVQAAIDEKLQKQTHGLSIRSINVQSPFIVISLTNAKEVIHLVKHQIEEWRVKAQKLPSSGPRLQTMYFSQSNGNSFALRTDTEAAREEKQLTQLAMTFLVYAIPNLPTSTIDIEALNRRLVPHLRALTSSPMHIENK